MGNEGSSSANRNGRTSSTIISPPSQDELSLRHPWIDPDTGLSHDTNHAQKEGNIFKKSEWIGEWRERYFILKGSRLFFSKGKFIQPHGVIDIGESKGVVFKDDDKNGKSVKGYAFELKTRNENWHLRCDNAKDREDWVEAIRAAISTCLSKAEFEDKYKAILYRGAKFVKYHNDPMGRFNLMNKDNTRIVKVSNDGQRVIWQKVGKEDVICDSIDLNSVIAVNPGHTTLVFKQTGNKKNERNCFSVIASERSLDLEASNSDVAREWVEALRAMLKYGNILSPAELREADRIRAFKEKGEESRKEKALKKHENNRAKLRAARQRAHQEI